VNDQASKIKRPFPGCAYSDRLGWERGVTDGGKSYKAGNRHFGYEGRHTAYQAGFRHGVQIEIQKDRR